MEILPSGTVTFLFTDIEGSTKLAREHPDKWEPLRQRHHSIMRSAMEANHGYVFQIIGDAFCVAFNTAGDALQAAGKAQIELYAENWGEVPIKVRMGLHTGKAELQESGEYTGYLALSRVQRVMSAGHGGQTLLSQVTQELVRDELPGKMYLSDLGEHRLKDLIRPEHIYQLNVDGLPVDFLPIKTLDTYRHNLPVQMTSFIGREKAMAEIKQALIEHRLVTLTGPGGSGKTRLSLQVAADLIEEFGDGAWFVDLAPLSDATLVPHAIADALNVREEGATPLIDLLTNYVQHRELLIVLDNCEHLVESSAHTADLLLHAAPRLKIIATSREGLGIAGEKTFPVPALSTSNTVHPSPASLSQYEATRLFIDRALLVQPHFAVNNENAPAVAQICHRLEGIPLAIELAAARVKAMSPEQISSRLDESFRLLTGGSRTALPRQQTLRATIDWSWELLSENERILLRRLSVFAGGWTLEAAEGVCAGEIIGEYDILDLLTQLVGKSLVIWHETQDEPRYQLLETIRQYAQSKLSEAIELDEEARVHQRHAEFYTQFAEESKIQIYSPAQDVWLKRLVSEQDNLRAALEWTVSTKSDLALRIYNAMGDYWLWHNVFSEGILWGERIISAIPEAPVELRAYSLSWTAEFLIQLGRIDQAIQYAKSGLDLARECQDKALLASTLFLRGAIGVDTGDAQLANECFEEALPLARAIKSPFILPGVLLYMGMMSSGTGDYEQAEAFLQESMAIAQRYYASFWQPMGLWLLGNLAFLRHDLKKARTDLYLGLQRAKEFQVTFVVAHIDEMLGRLLILDPDLMGARLHLTQSMKALLDMKMQPCPAHCLEGWARLAMAQADPQRAVRIMGAIDTYLKSVGMSLIPIEQVMYDQTRAELQQQLDTDVLQQEWAAGKKLNLEQAIELAMSLPLNPSNIET